MNWLTWRQHRSQAIAGYGTLAVIGGLLIWSGLVALDAFNDSGLSSCLTFLRSGGDCRELASQFTRRFNSMQFVLLFILVIPALVGMFWGAPLVARELEHGTHRLAWTQSVTRTRWITSKLAIVGGSVLVFSVALSALVTWWSDPFTKTNWGRLGPGIFDFIGVVPVAYTLFAFALGVALGTVTRKTLPAVFATLAGYAIVRIPVLIWLRPRYMSPKSILTAIGMEDPGLSINEWVLRETTLDASGAVVSNFNGLSLETIQSRCADLLGPDGFPDKGVFGECASRIGLRIETVYHPADRFWTFQTIEAAIFIALTGLLVWFIIRRVKRTS